MLIYSVEIVTLYVWIEFDMKYTMTRNSSKNLNDCNEQMALFGNSLLIFTF